MVTYRYPPSGLEGNNSYIITISLLNITRYSANTEEERNAEISTLTDAKIKYQLTMLLV
jgi:hypothetical protein